jgi:hypothetical protein
METHFTPKTQKHNCECGKVYSNNSGLWKHKKKCNIQFENNDIYKQQLQQQQLQQQQQLVEYLLKENSEFKQLMLEQNKHMMELDQKSGLTKAIKQVAHKNIKQISEWQKLHPDFSDPDSKQNDKYMKIVLNSMSGSTEEEQKNNINKIIRNVTKGVIIEK